MITGMTRTHTRRTQAQRTAETRTALLDATLELLVDSGYKATTTTAVAQRAGLSLGALLHHFPTKTDLLVAAVGHAMDRRTEEYRQVMTQLGATSGDLDASVDLLWSMFSGPTFTAVLELWVAARTDPELAEQLVAVDREFLATCERLYTEFFVGGDSGDIGSTGLHMVFCLLNGLAFARMLPGYDPFPAAPVIEAFKAMVRTTLAALQSRPPDTPQESI